jgi:hypothetical protein
LIRAHVEFTLLKAGLPWDVLERASEQQILRYYGIAIAEQERAAELAVNALG